jgi:DNA-binding MarR family transcriptional regulator
MAEEIISALSRCGWLFVIARNPSFTHKGSQTGVVERTGIDRSTLADIVRRLAKRSLVQRRRSRGDARAYVLKLSGEGDRVLRAAEPLAERVDARVLNALPRWAARGSPDLLAGDCACAGKHGTERSGQRGGVRSARGLAGADG